MGRLIRGRERTYGFRRISTTRLISQTPKYLNVLNSKIGEKGNLMEKAEKPNGHLWKVEKVSKLTTSPVVRVNPGGGWVGGGVG